MGFLSPSYPKFASESDSVKFNLIWRLSIIGVGILALLTTVFFFDESSAKYTYLTGLCLCVFGVFYLAKTKNYHVLYLVYATVGSLVIQIDTNVTLDTPHLANYFWILLIVIMTVFGCNLKIALFFAVLNTLGVIYYANFTMAEHYEVMHSVSYINGFAVSLEMACLCLFISYIIYLFADLRIKAESQLLDKNAKLEESYDLILKGNKEKNILVKEIHHRVKNNLQIIISLLRLQMTEVRNLEAKEHFSEAINRVMVMSSIHQKLYQEKDITEFSLQDYVSELSQDLKMFFSEEFPIDFKINIDYENMDLKTVVPLGLILNELLSNSFKYAFEEMNKGHIEITITKISDGFEMTYSDNGHWKDNSKNESGFGLELIDILTEQLNGTKSLATNDSGTSYIFNFKPEL